MFEPLPSHRVTVLVTSQAAEHVPRAPPRGDLPAADVLEHAGDQKRHQHGDEEIGCVEYSFLLHRSSRSMRVSSSWGPNGLVM